MLLMRELEREFRDLNKSQKDTLAVHEKMIATRDDRTGALRKIWQIAENKPARDMSKK